MDVMLVEDDPTIREVLEELLVEEGFATRTAQHGQHALELLHGGLRPKLILLDLMMPVMDGWAFLAQHQAHKGFGHIPIVVVSASRDVPLCPKGAVGRLQKPVNLQLLLDLCDRICTKARPDPTLR